jgi:hypothetical protein
MANCIYARLQHNQGKRASMAACCAGVVQGVVWSTGEPTHGVASVKAEAAAMVSIFLRDTSSTAAFSELTPAACVPVRRHRFGLTAFKGLKAETVLTRQRPVERNRAPFSCRLQQARAVHVEARGSPGPRRGPQSVACATVILFCKVP